MIFGPNLQNFVSWTDENVTKKSDTWKVYEENAILKKKSYKEVMKKTYDSLLADMNIKIIRKKFCKLEPSTLCMVKLLIPSEDINSLNCMFICDCVVVLYYGGHCIQ